MCDAMIEESGPSGKYIVQVARKEQEKQNRSMNSSIDIFFFPAVAPTVLFVIVLFPYRS